MKKLIVCLAAFGLGALLVFLVSPNHNGGALILAVEAPPPLTGPSEALRGAESFLSVPLSITAREAEALVDAALVNPLYDVRRQKLDDSYGESVADVLVERTGPAEVSFEDDKARVTIPFRFESLIRWKGKILGLSSSTKQEIFGGGKLLFEMKPAIDRDWKIHLGGALSVQWKENPAITLLGQKVGIARFLSSLLEDRSSDLFIRAEEELNRSARLRERAEEHWRGLAKPILLSKSPRLSLTVRPLALSIPPFTARGEILSAPVALRCLLSVASGGGEEPPPAPPLPELTLLPPNLEPGILLNVDARVSYSALEEYLADSHQGSLDLPGGGAVTIKNLALYGSGKKLIVALDISGVDPLGSALSGKVYLGGVPVYSRDDRVLRLEELEFDENSTSGLMRAASWIARPVIEKKIQEALVFPLDELRKGALTSLGETLGGKQISDGVTLEGSVEALELESLSLDAEGLNLSFSLGGRVLLQYNPIGGKY